MNAAQAQIEAAAATAKRKGFVILGYRPAVGLPKHPDGSNVLVIEMGKPRVWDQMVDMAKAANPKPRGVAVEKQGSLL